MSRPRVKKSGFATITAIVMLGLVASMLAAMGMMFDRVIVFDSGQLVEDGTHETLLAGNGIFKELLS